MYSTYIDAFLHVCINTCIKVVCERIACMHNVHKQTRICSGFAFPHLPLFFLLYSTLLLPYPAFPPPPWCYIINDLVPNTYQSV